MTEKFSPWRSRIITPVTKNDDDRRRGIILCILLLATIALSAVAMVASAFSMVEQGPDFTGAPPLLLGLFLVFFSGLYIWARLRYSGYIALIFIGVFASVSTYIMLLWGPRLPQGLLLYSLVITMAGILLRSRLAVLVTTALVILIVAMTLAQTAGVIHPDLDWLSQPPAALDAVGFAVTLGLLALVSLLATRETELMLARARRSESELREERNSLEVKVAERTHQLEAEQVARAMELHRFTEFGRVSAGFLHDIANPLTAAVLHLDHLGERDSRHSAVLKRARQSIGYVERYVEAARKQLQERSEARTFDIGVELGLVMSMLEHRVRDHRVKVEHNPLRGLKLYGDPVRFSQLIANLLTNAIEAYPEDPRADPAKRRISITVGQSGGSTIMKIRDWGMGLPAASREEIFVPFFSTKTAGGPSGMGLGLGLAIVKRIAETEFNGSVRVSDPEGPGTEFEVQLNDWHEPPRR